MIKSYKDTADESECLPKLASDLQQEFGKIFQFILEIWRRSTLLENDNTVDHTKFLFKILYGKILRPVRFVLSKKTGILYDQYRITLDVWNHPKDLKTSHSAKASVSLQKLVMNLEYFFCMFFLFMFFCLHGKPVLVISGQFYINDIKNWGGR